MKINNKLLCIPPYISTNWSEISSMHKEEKELIIFLVNGKKISIPDLTDEQINQIFEAHAMYYDQKIEKPEDVDFFKELISNKDQPLRIGISSIDEFGSSVFIHDSKHTDIPEVPTEILEKILMITQIISPSAVATMAKGEPNCNCIHCQLMRHLEQTAKEELVLDNELAFQQWDIKELGNHQYIVTNRLDNHESYRVCLGEQIGCTCGKTGCEHVVAVLKT